MAETSQQGAGTSGGAPASAERSRSQRHIVWDESNLEENERIKATLNPIKITEPKTPFHGPSPTTSETMDEEMRPLVLGHASEMLAMEHDGVEGGSGDEEFTSRRFFRPSITSDGDDEMGEALHLTEEEIAKEEAKKRKFAEARKAHYNMRQAMLAAAKEEEEDEDESAGDAGDKAGSSSGAQRQR